MVLLVAALALSAISFTGLTLIVGDPFYERIWRETELMLGGTRSRRRPRLRSGRSRTALVMILIGVATAAVLFVIGFLPVVGAIAGAVLGFVVSSRVLGAELLSRPLEARGMDRAARKAFLRPHRSRVHGFGMATQACFLVPFGAIAVMPAAVVGATMLGRELVDAAPARLPA